METDECFTRYNLHKNRRRKVSRTYTSTFAVVVYNSVGVSGRLLLKHSWFFISRLVSSKQSRVCVRDELIVPRKWLFFLNFLISSLLLVLKGRTMATEQGEKLTYFKNVQIKIVWIELTVDCEFFVHRNCLPCQSVLILRWLYPEKKVTHIQ